MPPFILGEARDPWPVVAEVVRNMARTRVVSQSERYLHAEVRSRVFRFVDDLELRYRPDDGVIAVRSASRTGRADLGVNRRRVERLRRALRARGVLR